MNEQVRNQLLRRWELKCQRKELEEERAKLEKELFSLYIVMHNEQVDVANLESRSIRNWFLDITGKKETMLQKERREAQTAKLNHDTASGKLEYTEIQIQKCQEELTNLRESPVGSWIAEENEDLIQQELQSAWDTGNAVLQDNESMIRQINNLIEQNRVGVNKTMMPSYLATAQKKINLLNESMSLFVEEASNLPIAKQIVEQGAQLLIIDEHLMDQSVGGLGADMLLGESHSALVASKKRLQGILAAIEKETSQL